MTSALSPPPQNTFDLVNALSSGWIAAVGVLTMVVGGLAWLFQAGRRAGKIEAAVTAQGAALVRLEGKLDTLSEQLFEVARGKD